MKAFTIVIIRQATERVWIELSGVDTVEAALQAYRDGEGSETNRKHLSTEATHIEDVYPHKEQGALSHGSPRS